MRQCQSMCVLGLTLHIHRLFVCIHFMLREKCYWRKLTFHRATTAMFSLMSRTVGRLGFVSVIRWSSASSWWVQAVPMHLYSQLRSIVGTRVWFFFYFRAKLPEFLVAVCQIFSTQVCGSALGMQGKQQQQQRLCVNIMDCLLMTGGEELVQFISLQQTPTLYIYISGSYLRFTLLPLTFIFPIYSLVYWNNKDYLCF